MAIFKRSKKIEEVDPTLAKEPVRPSGRAGSGSAGKKAKNVVLADAGHKARNVSTLAMRTILAPLATEKTARLADRGVYVFRVARDANRVAVKQAFRELYNVTPVKVNIVHVGGVSKRFGRFMGRTNDWKKALVTLPKGSHINVFESV